MAIQNKKSSDAVVIVACMDKRLHYAVEEKAKEFMKIYGPNVNVLVFRNAGASVKAFEGALKDAARDYNLKALTILAHNEGCKGMALVFGALKEGVPVSSEMQSSLVDPFKGHNFANTSELETLNPDVQAKYARDFLGKSVIVAAELVDLKRANVEEGEHRIFMMTPGTADYEPAMDSKRGGAYVLQASNLDQVYADLSVGVSLLKIRKGIFVASSAEEARRVRNDMNIARMKLANPEVEITYLGTY